MILVLRKVFDRASPECLLRTVGHLIKETLPFRASAGGSWTIFEPAELVPGKPLKDLVRHGLIDRASLDQCVAQIEAQLRTLRDHPGGFSHGDPHEGNILVELKPDGPRARLIDFATERWRMYPKPDLQYLEDRHPTGKTRL